MIFERSFYPLWIDGIIIMPLLLVSAFLDYLAIFLACLSTGGLAFISFRVFIKPALEIQTMKEAPPLVGHTENIILAAHENIRAFSIGQLFGDFNLRLKGIKEKHLVIKIKRVSEQEIYDIFLEANGRVELRLPHTREMERMQKKIIFNSAELISHTADFRLLAKASHYVEVELACEYYKNELDAEKMKFILKVTKIQPPVDTKSRNKNGIYKFISLHPELRRREEYEEDEEELEV